MNYLSFWFAENRFQYGFSRQEYNLLCLSPCCFLRFGETLLYMYGCCFCFCYRCLLWCFWKWCSHYCFCWWLSLLWSSCRWIWSHRHCDNLWHCLNGCFEFHCYSQLRNSFGCCYKQHFGNIRSSPSYYNVDPSSCDPSNCDSSILHNRIHSHISMGCNNFPSPSEGRIRIQNNRSSNKSHCRKMDRSMEHRYSTLENRK